MTSDGLYIDLAEPIETVDGRWVVAVWYPTRRPDVPPAHLAAAVMVDAASVQNFRRLP
jgi:hypothetical protein